MHMCKPMFCENSTAKTLIDVKEAWKAKIQAESELTVIRQIG